MKSIKEALLMLLGSITITLGSIALCWVIQTILFQGADTPESRFVSALPIMAAVAGVTLLIPFTVLNLAYQFIKLVIPRSSKHFDTNNKTQKK